eukprot:scaffold34678_cov248-Amphora_coffeaeformis.AAC.1
MVADIYRKHTFPGQWDGRRKKVTHPEFALDRQRVDKRKKLRYTNPRSLLLKQQTQLLESPTVDSSFYTGNESMRLQLSLAAQDLPTPQRQGVFAVVVDTVGDQLIGQTEVLVTTEQAVDWTKLFYIEDWELGQPHELVVTIYSGKESLGSVLLEVGAVLGAPGSRLAQKMKNGSVVVAHVEEATAAGTLRFQLRGWNLVNMDRGLGILNKSDPFFELQRWRARARVWDTVFRSAVINNDLYPLWNESFVEIHALCGGRQTKQKFRLCLHDDDANGKRQDMGHVLLTIDDMLASVNPTASSSDRNNVQENPGFTIRKGNKEMGKILIAAAEVIGALPIEDDTEVNPPIEPLEDAEGSVVAVSGSSTTSRAISIEEEEEEEIVLTKPTFVAYISGGCELRVTVAIDATSSNGDPRQESSLHHFTEDGHRNAYEEALFSLCSILSKYDSDQKYPVYAFGAKEQGRDVSHCFPVGSEAEMDGVAGILNAYRTTFRSGIVMSSPRNFSQVIQKATQDANEQLVCPGTFSFLVRQL